MTRNSSSFDVAVVGGGVIGLAIAWRAAQRGLRAIVLERGRPGSGASWVAAGMLAPITEARLNELPLLHLGILSASRYPGFVAELHELTGIEVGYQRYGTLVVARDRDDAESLEREFQLRRELGVPVSRLRPSEARALEPGLAPTVRLALEVADDHAVDPRRLGEALLDGARRAGAEVMAGTEVAEIRCSAGRVKGLMLCDGTSIDSEHVVIAAGAWTSRLRGLPDELAIPIHPVKGQLLRLHDPAGPGLLTRVLRTGGGYLVPRGDGRYVLGATMEERGFDTTVTAGAVYELLRDAYELVPGVSELVIDELIAGLRPATGDGYPAIGAGDLSGLHWAVGHYRNGILLAPITAEIIVAGIAGEPPPDTAARFAPARLQRMPVGA